MVTIFGKWATNYHAAMSYSDLKLVDGECNGSAISTVQKTSPCKNAPTIDWPYMRSAAVLYGQFEKGYSFLLFSFSRVDHTN